MQIVHENRQMIDEREKEITHIVKSIQDLNEVFKDLAVMIVDQVGFHVVDYEKNIILCYFHCF